MSTDIAGLRDRFGLDAACGVGPDGDNARGVLDLCDEVERLRARVEAAEAPVLRTRDDWHEDDGSVLWWSLPIREPPYVGSPLEEDFPEYLTHWTPIAEPRGGEGGIR